LVTDFELPRRHKTCISLHFHQLFCFNIIFDIIVPNATANRLIQQRGPAPLVKPHCCPPTVCLAIHTPWKPNLKTGSEAYPKGGGLV
jgi:hypothetical protein